MLLVMECSVQGATVQVNISPHYIITAYKHSEISVYLVGVLRENWISMELKLTLIG